MEHYLTFLASAFLFGNTPLSKGVGVVLLITVLFIQELNVG